jgi:hypothetical protein
MIKKANIQWSAKQLVKSIEKGTVTFDNAVQRGYVWDQDRKSLLIHSMIEGYPIPAFFAVKDENGHYSMLDGKQRSEAINGYINDKYHLTNLPEVLAEVTACNIKGEKETTEEMIDINGSVFSDLPEEIQDRIKDYSLTVYYFDGITEDEISEMFFRLNNGKPLTAIELTRVKAKSLEQIKEISRHDVFTSTLTEKAINKYTNEDIVIKSWAVLYTNNPNLETKNIRPLIEQAEITAEQADNLKNIYSRLLEVYTTLTSTGDKQDAKTAKRIITRTHLISLVPIISKQINGNTWDVVTFTNWAKRFFAGTKSATTNEVYNEASRSGSGKAENVKKRIDIIADDYKQYLLTGQDIVDSQAVA